MKEQLPPPVITSPSPPERKASNMKYAMVAVTVIVVVAVVTAGAVSGMYLMQKTSSDALKTMHYSFNDNGDKVDETLDEYNDRVYKFSVNRPGQRFSVVHDYSRRMVAIRKDSPTPKHCIILPLNSTDDYVNYGIVETFPLANNSTGRTDYTVFGPMIEDKGILGPQAQQMCLGLPVYWGLIQQECHSGDRVKRAVSRGGRCCCCCSCRCYCGCYGEAPALLA